MYLPNTSQMWYSYADLFSETEGIWKEVTVAHFKVLLHTCCRKTTWNAVRITGSQTEIQIRYLLNTGQVLYYFVHFVGKDVKTHLKLFRYNTNTCMISGFQDSEDSIW